MKVNYLFLFGFLLLFEGCGTFKKGFVQIGGKEEVAQNAILDFSNTSKLYKKDTVFSVRVHNPLFNMILEDTADGNEKWVQGEPFQEIVAVSIGANYNKILIEENVKVGEKGVKMPTRYIERDGKLFYWRDNNYPLTQEMLAVLKRYNLLVKNDMDGIIEFYDFEVNDAQKGVDYFFCEKDLTKFKKRTTNKGIGYYEPPSLECN